MKQFQSKPVEEKQSTPETVTKLILELQQNIADNGGILDYQRFESVLISAFKKLSTPSENEQWQSIFDFISFYLGGYKDNGKGQSILNTQVAEITIENLSKELADKFSPSSTPSIVSKTAEEIAIKMLVKYIREVGMNGKKKQL